MVVKKSSRANLENKKTFFVLIGFVLVLSLVFIAFEWSRKDINRYSGINYDKEFTEEILIHQTAEKTPPPPPPPPTSIEQILIVDNHTDTKTFEFTSESNKNEPIPFIGNPVPLVKDEEDTDVPFVYVESMPQFPGNIFKFLSEHIIYPVIAIENQIQGRVVYQFVVNRDGSIVDVIVIGSIHPSLDNEALRVIKSMPKWIPGKQRGKAVRVKYTLPVSFKLMM